MNCIVAQSGGPTSVINSSVFGLVEANKELKIYDNVYAGLNGIEGILNKNIINLSAMDSNELDTFRRTPSSGLGSCRYKLKDSSLCEDEYISLMSILNELNIKAFFYIGGNDSMDTTAKLSKYAKEHGIDIKFIGIPKTIDNDLMFTDHTPGFGSAAKFIATSVLETYLDSTVYIDNGIFILETMGRDTGWLAAAGALATVDGRRAADYVYLPEVAFDKVKFINDVRETFMKNNHVYIVASEGLRDETGSFLTASSLGANHDKFGHTQLGGVAHYLRTLIIDAGITSRVKTLELGVLQRCAMHSASKIDFEEAHMVGRDALKYSAEGYTGYMVAIKRSEGNDYSSSSFLIEADKVANKVKYFPLDWVNSEGNNITEEAIAYLKPLVFDIPELKFSDSLPQYKVFRS
ncbi:6-phosphofructokinase [Clostridium manihotivorum]|nr:6-phosphofructokinase [Clostridium manihotivorum]